MDPLSIPLNINKICIVCLKESQQMFPIHDTLLQENEGNDKPLSIFEFLTSVTTVKEATEAPTLICLKCANDVRQFYTFQVQCNKSQEILQSVLSLRSPTQKQLLESEIKESDSIKDEQLLEENEVRMFLISMVLGYYFTILTILVSFSVKW